MQYLGYLLVLIHLFLLSWSVGGLSELVFSTVPWTPFTNQDFPKWWLPIHWGAVLIASTGFLYGYFTHWSKTPQFMMVAYGMLAVVCAIETFVYMKSQTKYIAMASEYVAYTIIIILLLRSNYFTNFFK